MTDASKTALITGGAGGLGRAMAQALATNGINTAIFDIDEEAANERAAEINERCAGGKSCRRTHRLAGAREDRRLAGLKRGQISNLSP